MSVQPRQSRNGAMTQDDLMGGAVVGGRRTNAAIPSGTAAREPGGQAFLMSSVIRASTFGVSSITANSVAHIFPSSSLASGWKPNVE